MPSRFDVAAVQQRYPGAMHANRPQHLAAATPDVEDDRAVGDVFYGERGLETGKVARSDVHDVAREWRRPPRSPISDRLDAPVWTSSLTMSLAGRSDT